MSCKLLERYGRGKYGLRSKSIAKFAREIRLNPKVEAIRGGTRLGLSIQFTLREDFLEEDVDCVTLSHVMSGVH